MGRDVEGLPRAAPPDRSTRSHQDHEQASQPNRVRTCIRRMCACPLRHSLTPALSDLQRTYSECTTLERLKHPNIVEMYQWFETEKHIYIVMELARNGAHPVDIASVQCV